MNDQKTYVVGGTRNKFSFGNEKVSIHFVWSKGSYLDMCLIRK